MSLATTEACTMDVSGPTACEVAFDVVVAEGYTNASDVEDCGTTVSYGGAVCDPDAAGQAIFEAINEMRTQMSAWTPYLDGIESGNSYITCAANNIVCEADYDGDDEETERTFVRNATNIQATADAMTAAGTLSALEWTPGLYFAAKDQAEDLEDAAALTSAGADGSTFAGRVAEYGTAGALSTEILLAQGTDTARWAVLSMLIDDLDDADTGRTALLSSSATQAGVAGTTSATLGTIIVAVVDSAFVGSDADPCAEPVVAEESDSSSSSSARALFVAGSVALAAATLY